MSSFAEQFALADDRESKLSQLLPTTPEYYEYAIIQLFNTDTDGSNLGKIKEYLDAWDTKLKRANSSKYDLLRNRWELLSIDPKKPDFASLRKQLNFNGNYHQLTMQGEVSPTSYPTKLDESAVTWATLSKQKSSIYDFESDEAVALDRLWADRPEWRQSISEQATLPDLPGLVKETVSWLKHKESPLSFGDHSTHEQFTLDQLDELRSSMSSLIDDSTFVSAYIARLAPSDDVNLATNTKELEAYHNRLSKFIDKLSKAYNNYRFVLLYNMLVYKLNVQNKIDEDLFSEYMKLPKNTQISNWKYNEGVKDEYIVGLYDLSEIPHLVTPTGGQDEELVRQYLSHLLRVKGSNHKQWHKYLSDTFVDTINAETKLMYTKEDQDKLAHSLGSSRAQELKDRVEITLLPHNPRYFRPDGEVSIDVEIKNVPTLVVKVFEINTRRYYLENNCEVPTDIQLDGLIANYEQTFKYEQPSVQRHIERFQFTTMTNKRGLFVAEFIGNGVSSRAIIRKGKLSFIDRVGAAGHVFTVLDENNKKLKSASLWISGHKFTADKHGKIVVPFTKSQGQENVLITDEEDGFTSFDSFTHLSESYYFGARFFVERESLLSLNKSSVLIRPTLTVCGAPASLSLLTDVTLTIKTIDIDGAAASKEVKNFKLYDDAESSFEFQVPANLQSLSFTLSAKVKRASTLDTVSLSASRHVAVNQIDSNRAFQCFFLRRTAAGYAIHVLGKSGEPLPNKTFTMTLYHKYIKGPINFMLQSDESGVCTVGTLDDMTAVEVDDGTRWSLTADTTSFPSCLHALEGDDQEIQVPLMSISGKKLARSDVAFYETRGSHLYADLFDKLSYKDGLIIIKGLAAGAYNLVLKSEQANVEIKVTKGKAHSDYLFGDKTFFQQTELKPIQIGSVRVGTKESEPTQIKLVNSNELTRVHVFCTEFFPELAVHEMLDRYRNGAASVFAVQPASEYLNGRTLSEEYRYVLERRYAAKLPGNTLTRPSLLLQPWAIQSTSTEKKEAAAGSAFDSRAQNLMRLREMSSPIAPAPMSSRSGWANMDFKKQQALVLLNLKPDADGVVALDTAKVLAAGSQLRIVAFDTINSVYREVAISSNEKLSFKDLRLSTHRALKSDSHFTEQKSIKVLHVDDTMSVTDITTSKLEFFDTLTKVGNFISTIKANSQFAEFKEFCLRWPQLSQTEKIEKYGKYACHEFNYFIYRRDPEFCEWAVKPYLRNKKEKTFLDKWFIGADLTTYLEPFNFNQLNAFEKALLVEKVAAKDQETIKEHFRNKADTIAFNAPEFNTLFQTAIKGSDLETNDEYNLKAAQEAQIRDKDKAAEQDEVDDEESSEGSELTGGVSSSDGSADEDESSGDSESSGEVSSSGDSSDEECYEDDDMSEEEKEAAPIAKRMSFGGKKADMRVPGAMPLPKSSSAMKAMKADLKVAEKAPPRQFFQQVDQTQEYAETNYWKVLNNASTTGLVPMNRFWADFANRDPQKPFLSEHFIFALSSFHEMFLAFAVLDLPLTARAEPLGMEYKDSSLKVSAKGTGLIVFRKSVESCEVDKKAILVSQSFFDPQDRYQTEKGEQVEKYISEEFLTKKVYGASVVITNISSSRQRADVLLQIPVGAIPVSKCATTKSHYVDLSPYTTTRQEYYFYFPQAGQFSHFPVHVAKDEKTIAFAPEITFHVLNQLTKHDAKSWEWLSQIAPEAELLAFLQSDNLEAVNLTKMAWRMKDKSFFEKAIPILAERKVFSAVLWSFSLLHNDFKHAKEYLSSQRNVMASKYGVSVQSQLVSTDPVDLHLIEHLEYWPIVNARAHQLGATRTILNDKFKSQYDKFLRFLAYKPKLSQEDFMVVTYYMLLQDRIEDAKLFYAKIAPAAQDAATKDTSRPLPTTEPSPTASQSATESSSSPRKEKKHKKKSKKEVSIDESLSTPDVSCQLQYDYLTAYMDFYNAKPAIARTLANQYAEYPIARWNKMFANIRSQLKELDEGKGDDLIDEEDRDQRQGKLAASEPSLEFNVNASENTITLHYNAITTATVSYFKMDIELLFSSSPFVQQNLGNFSYITPNSQETIKLSTGKKTATIDIPKEFRNENVMIDITSGPVSSVKPHFSHSLFVNLVENYGQLKVFSKETNKPLSKVYIKVFSRHKDGRVSFYKDGYTDLRGGFDYCALNTNDLDTTERFSILVMSEKQGTRIMEASPPKK